MVQYEAWNMEESHAVYELKYHIVWAAKYRRGILDQRIGAALKRIFKGNRRKIRVRDRGARGDAGPRALVCECATAMESSGTGQSIEERVDGPADERAPRDERANVGRSLVAERIFCASHRR